MSVSEKQKLSLEKISKQLVIAHIFLLILELIFSIPIFVGIAAFPDATTEILQLLFCFLAASIPTALVFALQQAVKYLHNKKHFLASIIVSLTSFATVICTFLLMLGFIAVLII